MALVVGAGASLALDASAQTRPRVAGFPLVDETFTQATAPEFTGVGSACLTGAPAAAAPGPGDHPLGGCPPGVGPVPPPNGAPHGYLRLTDASNDQAGAVLYNQALPAGQGLDVTFDQWQYGSTTPATPADDISFFLVNGDGELTHPGAFGGSLGYAQKLPDDGPTATFLPGVDRGYLGVGLDVLGNYFGDWEHRGNGCATRSPAGTVPRSRARSQHGHGARSRGRDRGLLFPDRHHVQLHHHRALASRSGRCGAFRSVCGCRAGGRGWAIFGQCVAAVACRAASSGSLRSGSGLRGGDHGLGRAVPERGIARSECGADGRRRGCGGPACDSGSPPRPGPAVVWCKEPGRVRST